jgi:TolB-like protein/Flp pilus assembly protein TadD
VNPALAADLCWGMRFRFLGLVLEPARFALVGDGEEHPLRPAHFRVLDHLVRQRQRVVTKQELLEAGWPGVAVTPNSLTQCIKQLRELLAARPGGRDAIATAYGRGYRFSAEVDALDASEPAAVPSFRDRPALAVLPFVAAATRGSELMDLGGALAEDLTNRLSSLRWFPLISHATLSAWVRAGGDPVAAGVQLGARYVVTGTVRKQGADVRVTAELADTTSGQLIASERYQARFDDLFACQDHIASALAAVLEPELRRAEITRALRRDPRTLGAWEAFLRGMFHLWQYTAEDNRLAREWFVKAEHEDPAFAAPIPFHGLSHLNDVNAGWASDPRRSAAQALELARRGVALDPRDPTARAMLGGMLAVFGQRADALALLEGALAENPSFAWGHWALARGLSIWGRADEAVDHLATALRLSPRDPLLAHFHEGLAFAHVARGDCEAALAAAQESARLRADWPRVYHALCAAAAALGRDAEARAARARGLALGERRTLAEIRAAFQLAGSAPAFLERYVAALARGGWV